MTRPYCLLCALKHVSQAQVLFDESLMGYPLHYFLALGHLAEASSELLQKYPEMANEIRNARLEIVAGADVNLMDTIAKLHDLYQKDDQEVIKLREAMGRDPNNGDVQQPLIPSESQPGQDSSEKQQ